MSARKAKPAPKPPLPLAPLVQLLGLLQPWGRGLPLALLVLAGLFGLWYAVWDKVGQQVLSADEYWLTQQQVQVTPPPPWIQADIRAEVFRDASLDGPLSITSPELAARIADAFSLHPWVAKVRRVIKYYPARITVELDYRRPACLVRVRDQLLPVDEEGVLLPRLAASRTASYPRLEGVDTVPIGPEGTRWGDARVCGGAKIAALLRGAWRQLGLDRIEPSTLVAVDTADQHTYELVTRSGTRIFWGHPPGLEAPGEPPAADKLAWLLEYHKQHGSLQGACRLHQPRPPRPTVPQNRSHAAREPRQPLH